MKNFTTTEYRKLIIKDVKAALSALQNTSKQATYMNVYSINIIQTDFTTMERIKNKFVAGYLKYNEHIKPVGKGNDSQLLVSDQAYNLFKDILVKYNLNLGTTGLFDICSDSIFNSATEERFLKEKFNAGYNTYKVLWLKNTLVNTLAIKEESKPVKRMKL